MALGVVSGKKTLSRDDCQTPINEKQPICFLCFRVYAEGSTTVLLQLYFLTVDFILDERLLLMC